MVRADGQGVGSFLNMVYPVGAIYMSTISTSPATLFGGTWEQIQNRFLLCAGSTYSAGSTGGASSTTLEAANLPAQSGQLEFHGVANGSPIYSATGVFSNSATLDGKYKDGGNVTNGASSKTVIRYSNGGSGTSFTNMPPYLAVYVWKRTA